MTQFNPRFLKKKIWNEKLKKEKIYIKIKIKKKNKIKNLNEIYIYVFFLVSQFVILYMLCDIIYLIF